MGGCCGKKSPANGPPQAPPQQRLPAPPPTSNLVTLYKQLPGTRKVLYYNTKDRTAYHLNVSVPFKFHNNCGVAVSSKLNKMYFVGGLETESLMTAQLDDFSDDCMTFEIKYLTGRKIKPYPCRVAFPTLLVNVRGDGEDLYCVGGCQYLDNSLDQGTPAVLRHQVPEWETLTQMSSQRYCCPLTVLLNNSIYCLGGFQLIDGKQENKDSVSVYRLSSSKWEVLQFKFAPHVGCLAAPLDPRTYLIFGFKSQPPAKQNNALTLTETGVLNSNNPDCPQDQNFWYPIFQTDSNFSVISEDLWLYTFDCNSRNWTGVDMSKSVVEPPDYTRLQEIVPRTSRYYAFHVELGKNVIQEFNAVSGFLTESKYSQKFNEDAGIFVLAESNEVILIGGKSPESQQTSRTCIAVQAGTERIRALPGLLNPQQGVRIVEVEKKLYAMAGFSGTNSYSQMLSQQWTQIHPLILPVKYPACFALQQTIYLIGGEKLQERDTICSDVFSLNCMSGGWTKLPYMFPLAVCHASALRFKEGQILVFGGDNDKGEPSTLCYSFDGNQFRQGAAIDSQLELIFDDPPCYLYEEVFVYSRNGDLFKFNTQNGTWTDGVEEEEASLVTSPRV